MSSFASIVEDIKVLQIEEKEYLFGLLEKFIIEGRRNEIYRNYKKNKKEKNLIFSSDINKLKELLND